MKLLLPGAQEQAAPAYKFSRFVISNSNTIAPDLTHWFYHPCRFSYNSSSCCCCFCLTPRLRERKHTHTHTPQRARSERGWLRFSESNESEGQAPPPKTHGVSKYILQVRVLPHKVTIIIIMGIMVYSFLPGETSLFCEEENFLGVRVFPAYIMGVEIWRGKKKILEYFYKFEILSNILLNFYI